MVINKWLTNYCMGWSSTLRTLKTLPTGGIVINTQGTNYSNAWMVQVSQKTWEFRDEFDIVFVMN